MMSNIAYFLFCICLFFVAAPRAQEKDTINLFHVKEASLRLDIYPWGEELHLSIEGKAIAQLQNASLSISVYYAKNKVVWYSLPLTVPNADSFIEFKEHWGPINMAAQQILPGEYEVMLEFLPEIQESDIKKHWETLAQRKQFQKYKLIKQIRPEKLEFTTLQMRGFYIERMKILNALFGELMQRKKKAIQEISNKASLSQNAAMEFQNWLTQEYLSKISQEKTLLNKHIKQVFYPLYPITRMNMLEYCDMLENLARIAWGEFYIHHQKMQGKEIPKEILNARDDIGSMVRFIQTIHSRSARELGISLKKELGYLPPPGFF